MRINYLPWFVACGREHCWNGCSMPEWLRYCPWNHWSTYSREKWSSDIQWNSRKWSRKTRNEGKQWNYMNIIEYLWINNHQQSSTALKCPMGEHPRRSFLAAIPERLLSHCLSTVRSASVWAIHLAWLCLCLSKLVWTGDPWRPWITVAPSHHSIVFFCVSEVGFLAFDDA